MLGLRPNKLNPFVSPIYFFDKNSLAVPWTSCFTIDFVWQHQHGWRYDLILGHCLWFFRSVSSFSQVYDMYNIISWYFQRSKANFQDSCLKDKWPVLYWTGGHGGKCTGDKKHCCFHWEHNHGLNSDLKQRWYVYWTVKGSILNFRIILFHSFWFFSKLRFLPCPPERCYTGHILQF